jgi:hypothetical protein
MQLDFCDTIRMDNWFKILGNEHLILKLIYQKQHKCRTTITDTVHHEVFDLVQGMVE